MGAAAELLQEIKEKNMGRLEGKIAIVTGGASGMGEATCRRFVQEGAKVVIADVAEDVGKALAEKLGANAWFQKLDVAQEPEWEAVVAGCGDHFGPVDVLVNNAAILVFTTIDTMEVSDIDRLLGINLKGPILGMKHCGRVMKERGRGSIINISSVDGIRTANGIGLYTASKFGLRGVTKTAALEYGHHGVRVNSVHPGGVDTKMGNPRAQSLPEMNKNFVGVPMQRIGQPEEIAAASLFLASDDASYVNGAELLVDGGWNAGVYYPNTPGAPASMGGS